MLVTQATPGLSLDLVDNWAQTRYSERILSSIPWKRTEGVFVLQSPPTTQVGAVAASQGSASITGTNVSWADALNGFLIRINAGARSSTSSRVRSNTTGTLDRPFEQSTGGITTSVVDAGGAGWANGGTSSP